MLTLLQVGRVCEWLGRATNNVAEYTGLLRGLEAALACGAKRIKCLGDSKLVVEQVLLIPAPKISGSPHQTTGKHCLFPEGVRSSLRS